MYVLYTECLNKKLKLSIISDYQQLVDAQKLWIKIYSHFPNSIKKYNSETGEISKVEDIKELYDNDEYHFLLEMTKIRKRMFISDDKKFFDYIIEFPCESYYDYP
jgi:hypothetical protein